MASYSGIDPNIQAKVQFSTYIRLSGPYMRCSQLGGEIRRSMELRGFVEVREHGKGWYSAKFSSQWDYDRALGATRWRIGRYSIQVYRWEPNFQFGEVIPLRAGDVVEGWVQNLPLECWKDDVVTEITNLVCLPLGCRVLEVDTSSQRARFVFEFNGSYLPPQIQVPDGPKVVVSYSRARQCFKCKRYGHIKWTCPGSNPEPTQRTTSSPDRVSSVSGPTQFHGRAIVDPAENDIPSSSGITPPPRTVTEKNMRPEGAMIIEKGKESKPILYTLAEKYSEIDVAVKVTQLNDENGNLRRLTINPHIGDGSQRIKRVLCTSIDGADANRTLEDLCRDKGASLVVVLDKSSVLVKDNQIGNGLGFSASHWAEMIFPRVGAAGSARDVKGNCLLMWKREEVDVSLGDTDPSSQHLKFSASWLTGGSPGITTSSVENVGNHSDSSDRSNLEGPPLPTAPEELSSQSAKVSHFETPGGDALTSNCGDASPVEERSYEASSPSSPRSEYSYNGTAVYDESPPGSPDSNPPSSEHGDTDAEGSSAAFDESPPGSPDSNASSLNYGDTDADDSSGDETFYLPDLVEDFSTTDADDSSDDENFYLPDWEEDFSTDAEEISCASSAPSARSSSSSEEDDFLS